MLISHDHRFIYLKTVKTASTSTEVLFQSFCMPPKAPPRDWEDWHATEALVSKHGVVGERMKPGEAGKFFNHMSAEEVISAVGIKLWSSYFKFANVRNPWDKVVSHFFFNLSWEGVKESDVDVDSEFEAFVASYKRMPVEEFLCKQEHAMDAYIRYEHLHRDISRVAARLSVCIPNRDLPKLKIGHRPEIYVDYRRLYGLRERQKIEGLYQDWVEKFGYKF